MLERKEEKARSESLCSRPNRWPRGAWPGNLRELSWPSSSLRSTWEARPLTARNTALREKREPTWAGEQFLGVLSVFSRPRNCPFRSVWLSNSLFLAVFPLESKDQRRRWINSQGKRKGRVGKACLRFSPMEHSSTPSRLFLFLSLGWELPPQPLILPFERWEVELSSQPGLKEPTLILFLPFLCLEIRLMPFNLGCGKDRFSSHLFPPQWWSTNYVFLLRVDHHGGKRYAFAHQVPPLTLLAQENTAKMLVLAEPGLSLPTLSLPLNQWF